MTWEPERLDDQGHLTEADPGGMLPAVAASAAHIRTGHRVAIEAGVERLAGHGRPRAIVVAGMGAAGLAGDILAAVVGNGAPLPIVTARSYQLPGWVGGPPTWSSPSPAQATPKRRWPWPPRRSAGAARCSAWARRAPRWRPWRCRRRPSTCRCRSPGSRGPTCGC
ncbi:hypothetical protein [Nonomuraea salmonea]|uniref:hypothetical protein n=1 Tax=Nonomuraea salmonea TaxID=46181 RepID=UPI002FEABDF3